MDIILASKSPRRKEILNKINLNFKTINSNFDESVVIIDHKNPAAYCQKLAVKKTEIISKQFSNSFIIGADTIVYKNNKILGKPKNKIEAIKHLQMLNNSKHLVYTGVCLINKAKNIKKKFVDKTIVHFNNINHEDILYYIDKYRPYDKAGSYGIQDWSNIFIKKINGCFYNVVGFPLPKFYKLFGSDLNLYK